MTSFFFLLFLRLMVWVKKKKHQNNNDSKLHTHFISRDWYETKVSFLFFNFFLLRMLFCPRLNDSQLTFISSIENPFLRSQAFYSTSCLMKRPTLVNILYQLSTKIFSNFVVIFFKLLNMISLYTWEQNKKIKKQEKKTNQIIFFHYWWYESLCVG